MPTLGQWQPQYCHITRKMPRVHVYENRSQPKSGLAPRCKTLDYACQLNANSKETALTIRCCHLFLRSGSFESIFSHFFQAFNVDLRSSGIASTPFQAPKTIPTAIERLALSPPIMAFALTPPTKSS